MATKPASNDLFITELGELCDLSAVHGGRATGLWAPHRRTQSPAPTTGTTDTPATVDGTWVTTHGGIVNNGEGGCGDTTTIFRPAGSVDPDAI